LCPLRTATPLEATVPARRGRRRGTPSRRAQIRSRSARPGTEGSDRGLRVQRPPRPARCLLGRGGAGWWWASCTG